ncbi:MAG TPA: FAD binding domain-containing protein [Pseudonocardiaceae bacterium]|jgi:carbon-monoxide dehydrogenase medium subunit|nr:FAD binding domain-containing protein [Pseudonocardiaceae bacterium]
MTAPAYHRPRTLDEACALLADGDDSMVYGGGTAIQILIKQGVLFATDLVDVALVPGLADITQTPTGLRVGPMVTLRRMETDPLVRQVAPLAAEVYGHVANPRVRNTASVGGNVAHGDYRLDPPTALLVLDARFEITGSAGTRTVPAREFFVDFQQTAVEHGELITAVEIPRQPESAGACFSKLSSLSVNDWPCASAAALVVDGPEREVRIGLGALAHVPLFTSFTAPATTSVDDVVDMAKDAAGPLIDPIPDIRGGAEFKRRLGLVAVEEAVRGSWKEHQDDRRGSLFGRRRRR